MNTPFTTTRQFTISMSGTPVTVEAQIAFASYMIMCATGADGRPFEVSLDDLETFESYVEARIESTTTRALDLDTGREEIFTVASIGSDVLAILNVGGYVLPRCTPTFSEVIEAWHIDREYTAAIESDQPRAAAFAGYPPRPTVSQQGIGYRRAA